MSRHREILDRIIAEERDDWHFDPLRSTTDYSHVGNIRGDSRIDWAGLSRFASGLDETPFRRSVFDVDCSQNDDPATARNVDLIKGMGYDESSTSAYRIFSDEHASAFAPVLEVFRDLHGMVHPTASIIHQKPGGIIPWHYDTFSYYVRKFRVQEPRSVRRYLVFVEDWSWGHYLLVGNSVVHQWRAGDVITWPYRMRHLSANAGLTPKLTIQITGVLANASTHDRMQSE